MKKLSKSQLLATAVLAVGLTAAGAAATHAAATANNANPMSNLVNAIAQKFNLNTADVQAVFDEQHAQMESQHEQAFKTHIQQAVTDGKLTQEQADKIIAKAKELKANHETNRTAFEDKTEAERHAAMEAERTALQQWMADNNIPQGYLPFGPHGKNGRGPKFDGASKFEGIAAPTNNAQ